MTSTMTTPVAGDAETRPHAPAVHLTFPRVVRSEAIKLFTLRSTWWSIIVAAALSIGISVLMAIASADFGTDFPAVSAIVMPMQFTMLVAGILGAIVVAGEYSTGMIRSTLTAVPRRGVVLAAKALVVAVFLAVATAIIFVVAVVVTAPLLAAPIAWDDPALSVIPLSYGVLSMVVFGLIGVSFGFLLRNGAGAIAATVGVLFVAPIVVQLFAMFGQSWQWVVDLGRYLPMNASSALTTPGGPDDVWTPLVSLLVWAAAGLIGSWAVLRTRDA